MPAPIFENDPHVDAPRAPQLVLAARGAGLVAIDLWRSDGTPQIVYAEGRRASAESLGRRLVIAMREAIRPNDGNDDPAGKLVAAAVAFVELCGQQGQPAPDEHRAALSALVDAVTPYTRGERAWDEQDKTMVLTNGQRAWIRSWAGTRSGEL